MKSVARLLDEYVLAGRCLEYSSAALWLETAVVLAVLVLAVAGTAIPAQAQTYYGKLEAIGMETAGGVR